MSDLPILIRLAGTEARVSPEYAAAVAPLLRDPAVLFDPAAEGVCGRPTAFSLGRSGGWDYVFSAKLAAWVAANLRARGREASIVLPARPRPITPDDAVLGASPEPAAGLLAGGAAAGGLIRFDAATHPHLLVPRVLAAFPHARAVVGVPNRDQVQGWVRRLRAALRERKVLWTPDEVVNIGREPRVSVVGLYHLDLCRPDDFDLAVVPDARPLVGTDGRPPVSPDPHPQRDYRLLRHWHVPAYGFLPSPVRLSAGEEHRLWALFGWTPPVAGAGPAPVRVTLVVPQRPAVLVPDPDADPVGYKRQAVWENERRTRVVARVAERASANRDHREGRADRGAHPRVAVLVESPTHAGRLARRLVGWDVLTADGCSDGGGEPLGRAIVTEVWAARQPRLDVDVLVDARGWNPVALPGFPPDVEPGRVVELIDVADRVPRAAADLARRRTREYRRRGWVVAGAEGGDECPDR